MADNYKNNIKAAAWTYLEAKVCRFHKKPSRKLRWIGRMLKRSARALDRRDIEQET